MLPIGILLGLVGLALGAPTPDGCPLKNVTLTPNGFQFNPRTLPAGYKCLSYFTVPSGYYANIEIRMTGAGKQGSIQISDNYTNNYNMYAKYCESCNGAMNGTVNFPTDFVFTTNNFDVDSTMSVHLNITVRAADPTANIMGNTQLRTDGQPSLVYFQDFQPGTSYKFTAENDAIIRVAPGNDAGHPSDLQNCFVYSGRKLVATLGSGDIDLVKGQLITIYLAEKIPMRGAVLITDSANVNGLMSYQVEYISLNYPTSYAPIGGWENQIGATTIIGEKDGSTPIDVRQLNTYDGSTTTTFYSLPGGPLADHSKAAKMSEKKLPQKFGGNLNTFYVTGGMGSVKYSVGGN